MIRFVLVFADGMKIDYRYIVDLSTSVTNVMKSEKIQVLDEKIDEENIFANDFMYLSAEHLGPKIKYKTTKWDENGINPFGNLGQFVAPFLVIHGETFRVSPERCHENAKSDRLIDQVNAWMGEISPGIKIRAEYDVVAEEAKLGIKYERERLETDFFTPVNVGFGIPYVLPLVVELLIANKDAMVILENPESHLHPRGQSKIAKLMSLAAKGGVQIICESHSDHIINAIRVATKKGIISPMDVTVNYFEKDIEQNTHLLEVKLDDQGNLSNFPDGLLDEWGLNISELLV
ncbi:AAA family ATPase [Butyrivibrio sp. INlla14]|uniref:AAA family ATPase n=1 Tax=Butyrivibrio sp. INlla14 TaxID=1520808 RepID=UPI000876C8E1|nr:DUF3696 domain-containing protein [Butyrivibrio sp. INlla14]SCY76027.1 Protein of unknown function [Butyrivibrio sp. INlla14]